MMQDSTTKKTPVILFTYKRPLHTARALDSLSRCDRVDECRIYIYCGCAKSPADEAAVKETRRVVLEWQPRLDARIIIEEKNVGCARSIVAGVTEMCNKYGRAIVVEDDLVLDRNFINYMLLALDKYQDAPGVLQVAGFMYPIDDGDLPDTFFLPFMSSWGWATWDRAWKTFNWSVDGWREKLSDRCARRRFNLDGTFDFYYMLKETMEGRTDAWDILWYYHIFNLDGKVLYPRRSLVWNGGFDGSGMNCGTKSIYQPEFEEFKRRNPMAPTAFPEEVGVNEHAFGKVKKYLKSVHPSGLKHLMERVRIRLHLTD